MRTVLVAWVGHKTGMKMLNAFFQSIYSTVLTENPIICFQLSADVQHSITTPCTLLKKWEFATVSQYQSITTVLVTYSKVVKLLLYHSATKNENLLLSTSLY